jgi:hypothetical protein
MKVIFLDIDGVLNCAGSASKLILEDGLVYKGIDKERILRLKELVDKTNAIVVLTSTWRHHLYKNDRVDKYMRQRFKRYGIKIYSCVDYYKNNRGAGIELWLSEHPEVEEWVVIDDEWFPDFSAEISKHIVTTSFNEERGGLQERHVKKACNILDGKLNKPDPDHLKPREWKHVGLNEYIN